ncbi:MAG: hypothetical protein O2923_03900 [Verrucomicrobia bacterium]|nr:hypothetical protein [Verrucomicrobiota bacterium]
MAFQIDSDFPGGNIVVDSVDGDDVRLHQDLRDTPQDWFYWCFRVRGAEGRTLRFTFTRSLALGVRGPAVSLDGGRTWRWVGREATQGNSFTFAFPGECPEARLSFAMPYQASDWLAFAAGLTDNPAVSRHALCMTKGGREVEYVLLGCNATEPRHRVAITCRHHCCEMMASYAVEGLVQWVADDPGMEAQWMRTNVQCLVVPFVVTVHGV